MPQDHRFNPEWCFAFTLISFSSETCDVDLQLSLTNRLPPRQSCLVYRNPASFHSRLAASPQKKKQQEVGRGCVMYIIGNQISWVPSSCFLSETTCPLNWKPECNCHISSQRVPHFAACLANKPRKMFCIVDRRAALSGESLERPSLLWAEIFSLK